MRSRFVYLSVLLLGIARTAPAGIWYVATNGNDSANGSTWTTAKRTIQAAIDLAASNETVLVSNGVYATGGRVADGPLTNRVVIDRPITVRSVNGPSNTAIQGAGSPGDGAIRCAYVGARAVLSGFTLTNGTTWESPAVFSYGRSGAGAWCESSGVLTNCVLIENSVVDSGGGAFGGTLYNCTLWGNSASGNGGGAAECTLYNCTLSDNSSTNSGGGAAECTLNNCMLSGNTAYNGGGTYSSALTNCTLAGNSASNDGGGAEGGTLNSCTISNNSAGYNGGGADVGILTNCMLSDNSATSFGGGAAYSTLFDCILSGNAAAEGGGASDSGLTSCMISGNSAVEGGGASGGTLTNCTLTGNSAGGGGGAIHSRLNNCMLSENSAEGGGGAALCTLNYCTLTGNSATNGGGGGAESSTLNNCTLSGNSASGNGGGSYHGTLNNCTLSGNTALEEGGGSYYSTLNNCTLAGNSATNSGGGATYGMLNNCIVFYNTANTGSNYSGYPVTFVHSCTTPDPGGTGNIANDPQFVDADASDYHLRAGSPCIDRGTNLPAQGVTDLDGNPRIVNGRVDMGAFEYQGSAPPPSGYWGWAAAIANGLTNYSDCATGDGYPNLLKYATGSSATVPDDRARLAEELSNGFFQLRFNRNTNATDVTLIVESAFAATNGAPWRGIATNIQGSWGGAANVAETGTGTPVSVAVREPVPATNRYMRLRVTRP